MKKIWLDTDIGPDCDDAAALGMLLELCHRGLGEIACVTHCTSSPWGVPLIRLICGLDHVDVPVGTCKAPGFLAEDALLRYSRPVVRTYCQDTPSLDDQPDAAAVVRQVLTDADDGEVTLIAIGPLKNIGQCLTDADLRALFNRKVGGVYVMGGCFEREEMKAEWNIAMDIPAAQALVTRYTGPILFSPLEVGEAIRTGACLTRWQGHPIERCYDLYTVGTHLREAWDPVTVYAALMGEADGLCGRSACGTVSIDDDGMSVLHPDPAGRMAYLRAPDPRLHDALEEVLDSFCRRTMANVPPTIE